MSTDPIVGYFGARIFDGDRWHDHSALLVRNGRVEGIGNALEATRIVLLDGGLIAPGFVDLQVNGGGGHLIGATTTADDLADICGVHAKFGTTSVLPTLITDTDTVTDGVLRAGAIAAGRSIAGFLGLHLEGPHLAASRKGAHEPAYLRPMQESDLVRYENARKVLPNLLITVAAETVTPEQISRLVSGGIVVSIGHSDASYEVAMAAFRAGASMTTHLFNAMSQIGNRNPGLVGAALDTPTVASGIIADGVHVHPATFRIALAAVGIGGRLFLVSDSMAQAGTDVDRFDLNGRTIYRKDGVLRLEDGTLAGADLTMDRAVTTATSIGVPLNHALQMASRFPAAAIGANDRGRLTRGARADFVHMIDDRVVGSWVVGEPSGGTDESHEA